MQSSQTMTSLRHPSSSRATRCHLAARSGASCLPSRLYRGTRSSTRTPAASMSATRSGSGTASAKGAAGRRVGVRALAGVGRPAAPSHFWTRGLRRSGTRTGCARGGGRGALPQERAHARALPAAGVRIRCRQDGGCPRKAPGQAERQRTHRAAGARVDLVYLMCTSHNQLASTATELRGRGG